MQGGVLIGCGAPLSCASLISVTGCKWWARWRAHPEPATCVQRVAFVARPVLVFCRASVCNPLHLPTRCPVPVPVPPSASASAPASDLALRCAPACDAAVVLYSVMRRSA